MVGSGLSMPCHTDPIALITVHPLQKVITGTRRNYNSAAVPASGLTYFCMETKYAYERWR